MGRDDVYFGRDIENAVNSAEMVCCLPPVLESANDYPTIQSYAVGYKDGYRKALLAIVLAFGLTIGVEKGEKG